MTTEMYNPPHPGLVLREYLADISVTEAARKLHVSRATLSGILNGNKGISPEMSLRLAKALGTHDSFWHDMQSNYDLWQARRKKLPAIEPFFQAA
jgi:addiction module HigA family antidote